MAMGAYDYRFLLFSRFPVLADEGDPTWNVHRGETLGMSEGLEDSVQDRAAS
jgi:hypothetical protein